MANTKQAKKRAKQSEKNRQHNVAMRSMLRTNIKKVLKALQANDSAGAKQAFHQAIPVIDRMVAHGIIHKNKAARHKSRLNQRLHNLSSAAA